MSSFPPRPDAPDGQREVERSCIRNLGPRIVKRREHFAFLFFLSVFFALDRCLQKKKNSTSSLHFNTSFNSKNSPSSSPRPTSPRPPSPPSPRPRPAPSSSCTARPPRPPPTPPRQRRWQRGRGRRSAPRCRRSRWRRASTSGWARRRLWGRSARRRWRGCWRRRLSRRRSLRRAPSGLPGGEGFLFVFFYFSHKKKTSRLKILLFSFLSCSKTPPITTTTATWSSRSGRASPTRRPGRPTPSPSAPRPALGANKDKTRGTLPPRSRSSSASSRRGATASA